jgi:hypothetical protein
MTSKCAHTGRARHQTSFMWVQFYVIFLGIKVEGAYTLVSEKVACVEQRRTGDQRTATTSLLTREKLFLLFVWGKRSDMAGSTLHHIEIMY